MIYSILILISIYQEEVVRFYPLSSFSFGVENLSGKKLGS